MLSGNSQNIIALILEEERYEKMSKIVLKCCTEKSYEDKIYGLLGFFNVPTKLTNTTQGRGLKWVYRQFRQKIA